MIEAPDIGHMLLHRSAGHSHARNGHYYLVGGGIAALAAAAFLCRDARVRGDQITILEALDTVGGSLDAEGSALHGYVMRGGRMFESQYVCTYDLFASVPTLEGDRSVTREIFDWNEKQGGNTTSRLMRDGSRVEAPEFEMSANDLKTLDDIAAHSEHALEAKAIEDCFDDDFFRTNFWLMWSSTFGFRRWHSAMEFRRYLLRFAHMVPGLNRLRGTMRTTYNQYDSLVRPLHKWLRDQGVVFEINTRVTHIGFANGPDETRPATIDYLCGTHTGRYVLGLDDCVIVTLGSMTEGTTQGAMDRPARHHGKPSGGAWALWESIAHDRPELGRPEAFSSHVEASQWLSFTTTLHHSAFFDVVRDATGDDPSQGGLVTFAQSSWLISIVIPHQPHFPGQPEDVSVFWGYGLASDAQGDFVRKPTHACTGREIMTEILGHLGMPAQGRQIVQDSVCIPCRIPYATSQFSRRKAGDRPEIIPRGYRNLALIGQFCELPDDVVFTVEYSVRSAQTAVYRLLGLDRAPPPVFDDTHPVRAIHDALSTLQER